MRLNGHPEKLIIKIIKHTLESNSKSKNRITKTIKHTLESNSKSKNSQDLETPKLFLPYEKGMSEQLKRVANKYGLEVIFTRSLSLKSKLRTNPFKSDSACGVAYKVTCSCCEKYFGKSRRTVEESIEEHQAGVNNEENMTGLSQHLRESRHKNWKEVEINLCYIHIRLFNNLFKSFPIFYRSKLSAKHFNFRIKYFFKNCVSHWLQGSLNQIIRE